MGRFLCRIIVVTYENSSEMPKTIVVFPFVGLVLGLQVGYGSIVDVGSVARDLGTSGKGLVSKSSPSSHDLIIDVGIVFAAEPNYFCIPLQRLGVSNPGDVISVKSSCDCIRASIVSYKRTSNETKSALRVDFVQTNSNPDPSNLGVQVELGFANERMHLITL